MGRAPDTVRKNGAVNTLTRTFAPAPIFPHIKVAQQASGSRLMGLHYSQIAATAPTGRPWPSTGGDTNPPRSTWRRRSAAANTGAAARS